MKTLDTQPQIIDPVPQNCVMIDGVGDPESSPEFQAAIEALYNVSYTLKFARKKAGLPSDYKIGKLEGLWWNDESDFDWNDPSRAVEWHWTLMIAQPSFISSNEFQTTVDVLKQKKANPALGKLYFKTFNEGSSVQLTHIGPYNTEAEDIRKLHRYAASHDYTLAGKHHEIYLSDPRRSKPEKLQTILRQPVRRG